jgi:hypothetical protein
MPEEKKEKWLNYLALSTVILAVCTALSTFKAGGFSSRSILSQSQASNQWSYYQAKSIKGYLYENQADQFDMALKSLPPSAPDAARQEMAKKAEGYRQKVKRYDEEKAAIQKEALRLEGVRDDAQRHGKIFGLAVIFLQIAILLSSIAALMKRPAVWVTGLAVGAVGLVYFADGFFLFMN